MSRIRHWDWGQDWSRTRRRAPPRRPSYQPRAMPLTYLCTGCIARILLTYSASLVVVIGCSSPMFLAGSPMHAPNAMVILLLPLLLLLQPVPPPVLCRAPPAHASGGLLFILVQPAVCSFAASPKPIPTESPSLLKTRSLPSVAS